MLTRVVSKKNRPVSEGVCATIVHHLCQRLANVEPLIVDHPGWDCLRPLQNTKLDHAPRHPPTWVSKLLSPSTWNSIGTTLSCLPLFRSFFAPIRLSDLLYTVFSNEHRSFSRIFFNIVNRLAGYRSVQDRESCLSLREHRVLMNSSRMTC